MGCSGAKNPGTPQPLTLSATAVDAHSIKLDWMAFATAASYDLRGGSSCPLTAANFAAAQAVPIGAPKPAGTAETATAPIDAFALTASTDYCFAVYAEDTLGNRSLRSNVITARTAGP